MPKVFNLLSYDIAEYIEKYIHEHGLQPGDRLPTERELAAQLDITRVSVRQGYKRLLDQGVIRSENGYYVNPPRTDRSLTAYCFPYADTYLHPDTFSVKSTEYMPEAIRNICNNMLNADHSSHLNMNRFIEYLSDIPVGITYTAQTSSSMPSFPGLFYLRSMPEGLKQTQYMRVHQPSREEYELLELSEHDSMLMLVNGFQYKGTPIAVSVALCVGTRMNLIAPITI